MKLKVTYTGGINVGIDKVIEKVLKPYGFKRVSSGMCFVTGERDVSFEISKQEEK